jgi:hypothetical protein
MLRYRSGEKGSVAETNPKQDAKKGSAAETNPKQDAKKGSATERSPKQDAKVTLLDKAQSSALVSQFIRLGKRLRSLKSAPLLAIDVLLGMAVGSRILSRLDVSSQLFSSILKFCTVEFFEEYLDWFMGWPAGFKLNAMLTKFCGTFFLSLVQLWKGKKRRGG